MKIIKQTLCFMLLCCAVTLHAAPKKKSKVKKKQQELNNKELVKEVLPGFVIDESLLEDETRYPGGRTREREKEHAEGMLPDIMPAVVDSAVVGHKDRTRERQQAELEKLAQQLSSSNTSQDDQPTSPSQEEKPMYVVFANEFGQLQGPQVLVHHADQDDHILPEEQEKPLFDVDQVAADTSRRSKKKAVAKPSASKPAVTKPKQPVVETASLQQVIRDNVRDAMHELFGKMTNALSDGSESEITSSSIAPEGKKQGAKASKKTSSGSRVKARDGIPSGRQQLTTSNGLRPGQTGSRPEKNWGKPNAGSEFVSSHEWGNPSAGSEPVSCHPELVSGSSPACPPESGAERRRRGGSRPSNVDRIILPASGDSGGDDEGETAEPTMATRVTAFGGPNKFYLGPASESDAADATNEDKAKAKDERSLSKAVIKTNATTGKREIILQSLAPEAENTTVNGNEPDEHPFKAKAVAHIALAGQDKMPVVVLRGDPVAGDGEEGDDEDEEEATPTGNGASVWLMIKEDGTALRTHKPVDDKHPTYGWIKDSNNKVINQQIVALAATQPTELNDAVMFAAVADGTKMEHPVRRRLDTDPDEERKAIKTAIKDGMDAMSAKLNGTKNTAKGAVDALANLGNSYTDNETTYDGTKLINEMISLLKTSVYHSNEYNVENVAGNVKNTINTAGGAAGSISALARGLAGGIAAGNTVANGLNTDRIKEAAQKGTAAEAADIIDVGAADSADGGGVAGVEAGLAWALHEMMLKDDLKNAVEAKAIKPWKSVEIKQTGADGEVATRNGNGDLWIAGAEGFNRGIAVLKSDGDKLKVVSHDDLTKRAGAYLDHTTSCSVDAHAESDGTKRSLSDPMKKFAFYAPGDPKPMTHAALGDGVDMYWDEPLQRLYVGLTDVTRAAETGVVSDRSGGVCSVLVGQLDKNYTLTLHPVIKNVSSYLFQDDLAPDEAVENNHKRGHYNKYILGYYLPHDGKIAAKPDPQLTGEQLKLTAFAKKVRVMHTSTGLSYLIINGGVEEERNKTKLNSRVYAIPLSDVDTHKGYVARKDKFEDPGAANYKVFKESIDVAPLFAHVLDKVKEGGHAIQALGLGVAGQADAVNDLDGEDPAKTLQAIASVVLNQSYVRKKAYDAGGAANEVAGYMKNNHEHGVLNAALTRLVEQNHPTITALVDGIASFIDAGVLNNAVKKDAIGNAGSGLVQAITNTRVVDQHDASKNRALGAARFIEAGAAWGMRQLYKDNANKINGEGGYTPGQSKRDEFIALVNGMHLSSEDATQVGQGVNFLSFDGTLEIKDMQVVGDTVYVAVADARDEAHTKDRGIFASTALFDHDGKIYCWTPWQRVMGRVEAVHSFGIDTDSGNTWFLTTKDGKAPTDEKPFSHVKVTSWGRGDKGIHGGEGDAEVRSLPSTSFRANGVESNSVANRQSPACGKHRIEDVGASYPSTSEQAPLLRANGVESNSVAASSTSFRMDGQSTVRGERRAKPAVESIRTVLTRGGEDDGGSDEQTATSGPLSYALDAAFADVDGVLGLFDFGPGTHGFKLRNPGEATAALHRNRHDQFSMMVATGKGRVALVEMGRYRQEEEGSKFVPTATFGNETNTVCVFDQEKTKGKVLGNLGEITCAELARLPLSGDADKRNRGWLFVGGQGGLAVLTRADGRGWDTSLAGGLDRFRDASNSDNFPFGARWQFFQIKFKPAADAAATNPFVDVRKIVSDQDKYLYVMTRNEVYRLEMQQRFLQRADGTDNEIHLTTSLTKVASVGDSTSDGVTKILQPTDELFDMMVVDRDKAKADANDYQTKMLLATSRGLFTNLNAGRTALKDSYAVANIAGIQWSKVQAKPAGGVDTPLGNTLLLEQVSKNFGSKYTQYDKTHAGKFSSENNLYVTAFDENNKYLAVYRFEVKEGQITPITEKYKNGNGAFVPYFYKIGDLHDLDVGLADAEFMGPRDFVLRTKHVARSRTGFVERVPMLPEPKKFLADSAGVYQEINLDRDITLPIYMGRMVKDSATGAKYIPGEFGVRVNE